MGGKSDHRSTLAGGLLHAVEGTAGYVCQFFPVHWCRLGRKLNRQHARISIQASADKYAFIRLPDGLRFQFAAGPHVHLPVWHRAGSIATEAHGFRVPGFGSRV